MKFDYKGAQKVDLIIEGGIIATVNDKTGIVSKDKVIVIDKTKIIFVGNKTDAINVYSANDVIDASDKLVLPGLVNSHTHTPMTLFRGVADDIVLKDWLYEYVFPLEAKYINKENTRLGAKLAFIEMIRTGTTTFNDMYYFTDDIAQVAEEAGLRAVLSEGLIDFPSPNTKTPEEGFKYTEDLLNKYKNNELITIATAAHAPYTCSPELLKKSKALADKYNVPYHIHLSETAWEVGIIKEKYGKTPTQHLDNLGILGENVIAAHSVHLTPEDLKIYAKRKVGVAHNPQCNMKLSSGAAPIPEMLAMGIKVGLGTDGVVSNNDLDMFGEMKTCSILHKFVSNNPTVTSAKTVFELSTLGSAKVLGMEDKIGSIDVGKKADLIIIDLHRPHLTPMYNLYSQIVFAMKGSDVETVIVNGRIIMKENKLLTIDEDKVIAEVNEFAKEIKTLKKYKLD
ncbi:MAG TPA: S-adenosylhomocysteine deaminase [Bacteroidales bacterium]|nr:MAG: hypothetical protein A2W98_09725 [Bacteroidetes bacterium GWF2_33_38]OFY75075.1 MAG: hypothetical protein A2265_06195 [Bacteroidetes bacterium RIFOXYA12_FULL_33_9]HBF88618.1 S-adenosylhomocysteine deaminase [Bacteroidales bacterium]